ncbi:hypothetical protein K2173_019025 [Erythroxylum novogranatense]|uniref:Uncharacterized protein n=1 Tax=Erythroxylum novogranatense TaxID=1862640 RepID=A0AAV8SSE8_9ROSI|nr:hypothetical protein K2173_019025 [Erythroxylum novogranatense]
MNSLLPYFASSPQLFTIYKCPQSSFSVRRRRSSRHRHDFPKRRKLSYSPGKPSPDSDAAATSSQNLQLVLDVDQISSLASSKFHHLRSSAFDAYHDLTTLISFDENRRIVFSCRKSTIQFTGFVLLSGFVLVSAVRFMVFLGAGFRRRLGFGKGNGGVVVRRDRSLGGREVVVARRESDGEDVMMMNKKKKKKISKENGYFPIWDNPLWSPGLLGSGLRNDDWRRYHSRNETKLPKWWPVSVGNEPDLIVDQQEYQREVNTLVRQIMDNRTSGKDVMEEDIIQLRRICRTSGVQATFDTTNTRDCFYRASIDFVLSVCSRAPSYSTHVKIDNEDAQQFIAGLARNIGLDNARAARMVLAAVAARTRSCFLQAWALEVQGKHSEAVFELSKICPVLQTFPPEDSSPEMEMVARGLGKHLKVEQREILMNMFTAVCNEESHRSAAEALGLMFSPKSVGDQQETEHT